jgi:hypothetical protein
MAEVVLRFVLMVALSGALVFPAARPCSAQGRAEPSSSEGGAAREPADYKPTIDSAVGEFEHGNFEEAREHFARAHALFPNARTLRGLGMVEFELRNYVDAVTYLKAALRSEVKPLAGSLRSETERLLQRALAYVGSVRLRIQPNHAELSVDGFPVAEPSRNELILPVGDHVLELHAEGYVSERHAIKLRGEQVLTLELQLTRAGIVASAGAPPREVATDRPGTAPTPAYKRWWLWTSVGLVLAGGITAAVLLTRDPEQREQPVVTANTPPDAAIFPWRLR